MKKSKLINLIKLPKIWDDCFLVFAQYPDQIPFRISRIYYIYNPDTKLPRGYHAHKKNKQILFCLQGSVKIVLDNGREREELVLSNPEEGIFLDSMIWHEMHDFRKNTILLILASRIYESQDYIREYPKFLKLLNK